MLARLGLTCPWLVCLVLPRLFWGLVPALVVCIKGWLLIVSLCIVNAAGVKKKLAAISLKKQHRQLSGWIKSICNHLYWVVSTSDHATDLREEKWLSLLSHITDVHEFDDNKEFHKCEHDALVYDEDDDRDWICKGKHEILLLVLAQRSHLSRKIYEHTSYTF